MSSERHDSPTGLDDALGRLPQGIEPPRDLWPAIEARLEPRAPGARRRWLWPTAAAAVLLVVASSLITATVLRRDDVVAVRRAGTPPAAAVTAAAFGPGQALGPSYLAARQELTRSLESRIERLPPEGRRQLEKNLAELHRASAEINAALARQPGDPLLQELLLSTYQEELGVLASVNQLTGTSAAEEAHQENVKL